MLGPMERISNDSPQRVILDGLLTLASPEELVAALKERCEDIVVAYRESVEEVSRTDYSGDLCAITGLARALSSELDIRLERALADPNRGASRDDDAEPSF